MKLDLYFSDEEMIEILTSHGFKVEMKSHTFSHEIHRGIWEDEVRDRALVYDTKGVLIPFNWHPNLYKTSDCVEQIFYKLLKDIIKKVLLI